MTTYSIDPTHSSVAFSVRHMMFAKVRGRFAKWTTDLALDPRDLSKSSVKVTIDAASIDTGVADRDAHLRSADFFDVEHFPTLSFESTSVAQSAAGASVTGNLTIRGITRPVTLELEALGGGKDPWGNERRLYSAKASILRSEFGLTWNQALEAGGVLVSDKIEIEVEVQAVGKAATDAAQASAAS